MIKVLQKVSSNKLRNLALAGVMAASVATTTASAQTNPSACKGIRSNALELLKIKEDLIKSDGKITHDEFISYSTAAKNMQKSYEITEDDYIKAMESIKPLLEDYSDSRNITQDIAKLKIEGRKKEIERRKQEIKNIQNINIKNIKKIKKSSLLGWIGRVFGGLVAYLICLARLDIKRSYYDDSINFYHIINGCDPDP